MTSRQNSVPQKSYRSSSPWVAAVLPDDFDAQQDQQHRRKTHQAKEVERLKEKDQQDDANQNQGDAHRQGADAAGWASGRLVWVGGWAAV